MERRDMINIGLVILAGFLLVWLYRNYSKPKTESKSQEQFYVDANGDVQSLPSMLNGTSATESEMSGDMETSESPMMEGFQGGMSVQPSETLGANEVYSPIAFAGTGEYGLSGNQFPKDCFPKDQLTPAELLPGNANSKWAQSVPSTQGELGDQQFLAVGFHVGVNTVGQTLRNANRQLRSEPPNPQVKVSPWLQTTIEPDSNRRPLEIGGCE